MAMKHTLETFDELNLAVKILIKKKIIAQTHR
jgi:hypothetical protein